LIIIIVVIMVLLNLLLLKPLLIMIIIILIPALTRVLGDGVVEDEVVALAVVGREQLLGRARRLTMTTSTTTHGTGVRRGTGGSGIIISSSLACSPQP
jgi:hypothetical protein